MGQQGWSRGLGANLLAADTGSKADSSGHFNNAGSGIYAVGEVLAQHYEPNNARDEYAILVAKVPIRWESRPNIMSTPTNWDDYKQTNMSDLALHDDSPPLSLPSTPPPDAPPAPLPSISPFMARGHGHVSAVSRGFVCNVTFQAPNTGAE